MAHKTQTVVRHWIDLTDAEQFDLDGGVVYRSRPVRVTNIYAEVVDGSLSTVRATACTILKSGGLGQVPSEISVYRGHPTREPVLAVLKAHGIKTTEEAR